MLPELNNSEASLTQVADLFVLLYVVDFPQCLEDAIEMGGIPGLLMGDRRAQISDSLLADRAHGEIDLWLSRFLAASTAMLSLGPVVTAHDRFSPPDGCFGSDPGQSC
jgi:hypothetical protein